MATSTNVYLAARKLIGTPYLHQGRLPGKGCDCLGVPVLVGLDLGLFEDLPEEKKAIALQTNYPKTPNGLLKEKIESICPPILLQPGALLIFRIRKEEQHCGVVSELDKGYGLIHACDFVRPARVLEERLEQYWISKVTGCYGLPGVNYG